MTHSRPVLDCVDGYECEGYLMTHSRPVLDCVDGYECEDV